MQMIQQFIQFKQSINRNIVECKGFERNWQHLRDIRINRNIVECKVEGSLKVIETVAVLIETLWNVKRSEFLAVLGDQKY